MDKIKPCIFCGKVRGPSFDKEDVLPKWLITDLPEAYVQVISINGGRSYTKRKNLGLVNSVVCKACNNGWMSKLESQTAEIIKPILARNVNRSLSLDDQLIISRWLIKTSMMLDFLPNETPFYTSTDYFEFYRSFAIPSETVVFIGSRVAEFFDFKTRKGNIIGKYPKAMFDFHAHITTLALGRVILQAFTVRRTGELDSVLTPLPDFDLPDHWKIKALMLYPQTSNTIIFPPEIQIHESEFDSFEKRWEEFVWRIPENQS